MVVSPRAVTERICSPYIYLNKHRKVFDKIKYPFLIESTQKIRRKLPPLKKGNRKKKKQEEEGEGGERNRNRNQRRKRKKKKKKIK